MGRSLIPAFFALAAITYALPGHAADASRIQHACAVDMGLNTSEAPYQVCVASLQQDVAALQGDLTIQAERQACMARGLQPGTSDFALCLVRASNPAAAAVR